MQSCNKLVVFPLIGLSIASCQCMDTLGLAWTNELRNLRSMAGYCVEPKHYDTVGAVCLWTLKQGSSASFTDEVPNFWAVVYSVIAKSMIDAAALA